MQIHTLLETEIKNILGSLKQPKPCSSNTINTELLLYQLAISPSWTPKQWGDVNFISKRLDISGKLFTSYQLNERKEVRAKSVEQNLLNLATLILMKAAFNSEFDGNAPLQLKRFNVLFKSLDLVEAEANINTELLAAVDASWNSLLQVFPKPHADMTVTSPSKNNVKEAKQYKTIPLTVMFYEGPMARAYLSTIKSLGFKPKKIIELIAGKDIATKKPVGKWLPKGIRKAYAANIQRSKIHYWPKQLKKDYTDLTAKILNIIEAQFQFSNATVEDANSLKNLSEYCDKIDSIMVDNLLDKRLLDYLTGEQQSAILFTGGGILPEKLLALPQLKFLHIHPGFLPDIRGADCALWSTLLTGHTSATCFYMSPGIDTGDIILSCWLPKLEILTNNKNIDLASQYRAVYSFIDPWVRAFVLRKLLLCRHECFSSLKSTPQLENDGVTFHFMHERLKVYALGKLLI